MEWANPHNSNGTQQTSGASAPSRFISTGLGEFLVGPGLWIESRKRRSIDRAVRHIATHRITAARTPGRRGGPRLRQR